jgi:putative NIF3 family GTP cyclohydrolase 1 type 2
VFDGGPEEIERIAVITGGAARLFPQIAALRYDVFVTGEPSEPTLHAARELGTHFLAGGHYATETFGINALAERVAQRFDLDWEFVDLPNPV